MLADGIKAESFQTCLVKIYNLLNSAAWLFHCLTDFESRSHLVRLRPRPRTWHTRSRIWKDFLIMHKCKTNDRPTTGISF